MLSMQADATHLQTLTMPYGNLGCSKVVTTLQGCSKLVTSLYYPLQGACIQPCDYPLQGAHKL